MFKKHCIHETDSWIEKNYTEGQRNKFGPKDEEIVQNISYGIYKRTQMFLY